MLEVLCAEHSCMPDQFRSGRVEITELAPGRASAPHHRSWPQDHDSQWNATGIGLRGVVSATADWIDDVRKT